MDGKNIIYAVLVGIPKAQHMHLSSQCNCVLILQCVVFITSMIAILSALLASCYLRFQNSSWTSQCSTACHSDNEGIFIFILCNDDYGT